MIAVNLDGAIRKSKMTNRQVGEAIGTTEHQVWRWRKGKVKPGDETLLALAALLFDGKVSEFYEDEPKAAA